MNEAIISHRGPGHLWLARQSSRGVRWQLDRVRALLAGLDHPERAFPSVVVAGTNGKGSVSAMLAAMLGAGGAKVGHFTSPHLTETRERVRVGDRCVTAEALDEALVAVAEACDWQTARPERRRGDPPITDEIKATPFEALFAAASWLYRREQIDIAVYEAGLGGRLDATNCADADIAVLTRIDRDHTKALGDTLACIAREKVAIARDGRPLIAAQPSIVLPACRSIGVAPRLLKLATDLRAGDLRIDATRMRTAGVLDGPMLGEPLHVEVSLPGEHQVENAALAVMAYVQARELLAAGGLGLLPALEVVHALGGVSWPCRAEVISDEPFTLMDAAHNGNGGAALAKLLGRRSDRWQVLLTVAANRNPEEVVRELAPITQTFWVPRMESDRLHEAREVARVIDLAAPRASVAVGAAHKCLLHARREAFPGAGVAITGSIYGIGELLHRQVVRSPRLARWLDG